MAKNNPHDVTTEQIGAADIIQHRFGSVINVDNSASTPIKGLKLFGKTTQNGTPTPESPVELENIGGKNYLPKTEYTVEDDGSSWFYFIKSTDPFPTLEAGDYILSFDSPATFSGAPMTIDFYGATGTIVSKSFTATATTTVEVTLPSEATGMQWASRAAGTVTNVMLIKSGSGKIGVTVAGKNLFDDSKADYNTKHPVFAPAGTAFTFSVFTTSGNRQVNYRLDYADGSGVSIALVSTNSANGVWCTQTVTAEKAVVSIRIYNTFDSAYTSRTIEKAMVRIGNFGATTDADYEPYKEPQTLTANTPNGLPGIPVSSGGNYTDANGQQWICDEIDFARGVYVQRVGRIGSYADESIATPYISSTGSLSTGATVLYVLEEFSTTALSAEELEAYALLHTNKPNTTVMNDAGAGMEITYYTPTTAVQMVHSPADAGKILSIDEHGCVVLVDRTELIADVIPVYDGSVTVE